MKRNRPARNPESGYALLVVYAMAATVAIMLFMQLPRAAFEAQREKEQLLIDRGEQYSRAINLYVRKFNRYPADFDALDNTQNIRFLRHHYIDPLTGKDEWRVIHVGPGGVFTDSLVYGKKKDAAAQTEQQNFVTELQQTGGNPVDPNQSVNLATRRRPSDQPGMPGDPGNPNNQGGAPQLDVNGQPVPGLPFNTAANAAVQVLPDGRVVPVQMPLQGNAAQQAGAPGFPPGVQPPPGAQLSLGAQPSPAFGIQPGSQQPNPVQYPFQQGPAPNGPPPAAANLINQLLMSPRPVGITGVPGLAGTQPTVDQFGNPLPQNNGTTVSSLSPPASPVPGTPLPPMGGQAIGGGMAGVASKVEKEGIKVYNDRTAYNEWEFVYDITKDPARTGGAVPQQTTPAAAQNGNQPGNTPSPVPAASTQTSQTPSPQ